MNLTEFIVPLAKLRILEQLKQDSRVFTGIWVCITTIVSLVLNSLVLLVINRTNELRCKPFLVFVSSLAATDLIAAFASPIYWYQEVIGIKTYSNRVIVCPIYWGLRFLSNYSTTLHVTMCVLFRFVGASKPFLMRNVGVKTTKKISISIWIVCLLVACLPMGFLFQANEVEPTYECHSKRETNYILNKYIGIMYPAIFLFPGGVTLVFTVLTVVILKKNANAIKDRTTQTNNITLQLSLIVLGYFLGYMPDVAFGIFRITRPGTGPAFYFVMSKFLILRTTECLNPILYNLGSKQMRKCTKDFLFKKNGNNPSSQAPSTQRNTAPRRTSGA